MLINLSNHPSPKWQEKQTAEAIRLFGTVVDVTFPVIKPEWNTIEIEVLASKYLVKLKNVFSEKAAENQNNAVHIMGELTFCFALIKLLNENNITCVASTTNRNVTENGTGNKSVAFSFIRFRRYPMLF